MKTFRLLFFLASVTAISATFNACKTPDDPPPPSLVPSISCPTAVTQNVDYYQDIVFNFTFNYNSTSKKSLSRVKIVAKYTPGTTVTLVDTPAGGSTSWSFDYIYSVSPTAPLNQVITITVSVVDIDGKIGSKIFTFTVKDLSDIIQAIDTLGAQSSVTFGSYFAADLNKVYKSGTAKQPSVQPRIDFVYLNDDGPSVNGDCIAAPDDPLVSAQSVDLCGTFTTANKNATRFKQLPPMTDSAYNKIRTSLAISQLFNNGGGTGVGAIKTLVDGSGGTEATIIVFKTVATIPQYGIIKVKEITVASQQTKNTMILNVKVTKK